MRTAVRRATFTMLDGPAVEMQDLAINVFGEVAIAAFNGHLTAQVHGNPVAMDQQSTLVLVTRDGDWKIVHEHFSPIGEPRSGR